jgi:hypothetical protein
MGPYIIVDKNSDSHVYKLVTIGGEPYPSWVHVDRLKVVKAESIDTPWYNPTVSRAAWRAEMGLNSQNQPVAVSPGISGSSSPVDQVDQSRSTISGGNDVVPRFRFKPNLKRATQRRSKALESSGN